ncbi:hypothetical protein HF882_06820 [Victivallis vadensis]|mgnify:FL=1|uniref:Uncharacterized protein n=1 Tax=Victivallis vadensis TaxID=172901 RepID=A0A848ASF0_9BACT|nr:hypothetical protein [Victivallis vadensis]NMD86295.1 hypothetical protein [Victivallis vadensis]
MFHPDTDVIIQQPDAIVDGRQTYTNLPARGRVIDFSQRDVDYFGTVQEGKIILIAPPDIPKLPARIVAEGVTYDLKSVRICRDLSGRLVGCRCAVV